MGQESKGLKVRPATVADAGALAASIRWSIFGEKRVTENAPAL